MSCIPEVSLGEKKIPSGEFASRLKNFKIKTRTLLLSPLNKEKKRWRKSQMPLFFHYGRKFTSDKKIPFASENNLSMCWAFWVTAEPGLSVDCSVVRTKRAAFLGSIRPSDPCLPQFSLPSCFSILLGVSSRNIPWGRTPAATLVLSCSSKSSSGKSKISVCLSPPVLTRTQLGWSFGAHTLWGTCWCNFASDIQATQQECHLLLTILPHPPPTHRGTLMKKLERIRTCAPRTSLRGELNSGASIYMRH